MQPSEPDRGGAAMCRPFLLQLPRILPLPATFGSTQGFAGFSCRYRIRYRPSAIRYPLPAGAPYLSRSSETVNGVPSGPSKSIRCKLLARQMVAQVTPSTSAATYAGSVLSQSLYVKSAGTGPCALALVPGLSPFRRICSADFNTNVRVHRQRRWIFPGPRPHASEWPIGWKSSV